MSGFNGSGVFTRIYNWVNDKNNGIKIIASRMDGEDNGFAGGLSMCVVKDGQQTTTARIPFAQGISSFAGAVGTPALSIISDPTTGIYQSASGALDVASEGVRVGGFNANGLDNTVIGAGTPQPGHFTTLAASGAFSASNISGTNTGDQTDATLPFTDNTTNNVSTTKHGYAPKLPGTAITYLDGTGNYSTPPSHGITQGTTATNGTSYTAGSTTTTAHGLSGKPQFLRTYLRCLTSDIGYTAGQDLEMACIGPVGGGATTWVVYADATNVYINTLSGGTPAIPHGTNHSNVAITVANWQLRVDPSYYA